MFRSLRETATEKVRVEINGQIVEVPADSTVWAAMALTHNTITRTSPVTMEDRSAYCAMGVCFECLVEIDGLPNQQACLKKVSDGMRIKRQNITQTTVQTETVQP